MQIQVGYYGSWSLELFAGQCIWFLQSWDHQDYSYVTTVRRLHIVCLSVQFRVSHSLRAAASVNNAASLGRPACEWCAGEILDTSNRFATATLGRGVVAASAAAAGCSCRLQLECKP
jgi:hypothetical protein